MSIPDTSPELWQQGEFSDQSLSGLAADASNIRFGTNPAYTADDFLAVYPQFGRVGASTLTMFVNLASACLSADRWAEQWQFAMALFTAHYTTLYLQSSVDDPSQAKQVVSAGLARGIAVSKTAGDVSVSHSLVAGWDSWGAFNLTSYGQQLITMAKLVGSGPMFIW